MKEKETYQLPIKCSTMKKANGVIEYAANVIGFFIVAMMYGVFGIVLGIALYGVINNPDPGAPFILRVVVGIVILISIWMLVEWTFWITDVKFTCIKDEETK